MLILLPCLPIGVIGVEVSVDIMGLGRDWGEVDGARGRNSSTSVEEKSMGCCRTLGGGGGKLRMWSTLGTPCPCHLGNAFRELGCLDSCGRTTMRNFWCGVRLTMGNGHGGFNNCHGGWRGWPYLIKECIIY